MALVRSLVCLIVYLSYLPLKMLSETDAVGQVYGQWLNISLIPPLLETQVKKSEYYFLLTICL